MKDHPPVASHLVIGATDLDDGFVVISVMDAEGEALAICPLSRERAILMAEHLNVYARSLAMPCAGSA